MSEYFDSTKKLIKTEYAQSQYELSHHVGTESTGVCKLTKEILKEVETAFERLKDYKLYSKENNLKQIEKIEKFLHISFKIESPEHMLLYEQFKAKLAEGGIYKNLCETISSSTPSQPKQLDKSQQKIHSIWVQGDYTSVAECMEAFENRKENSEKMSQWQHIMWLYNQEPNVERQRQISKDYGINFIELNFKKEMIEWTSKPEWVEQYLPLLDSLYAKKNYVAMSDIMRMIILYYQGGLYLDSKIKFGKDVKQFFENPMVKDDNIQLVLCDRKENWAMMSSAGCEIIDYIMQKTLTTFPKKDEIDAMPENYQEFRGKTEYLREHVQVHEDKGPWRILDKYSDRFDAIKGINKDLQLINPRTLNSWSNSISYINILRGKISDIVIDEISKIHEIEDLMFIKKIISVKLDQKSKEELVSYLENKKLIDNLLSEVDSLYKIEMCKLSMRECLNLHLEFHLISERKVYDDKLFDDTFSSFNDKFLNNKTLEEINGVLEQVYDSESEIVKGFIAEYIKQLDEKEKKKKEEEEFKSLFERFYK